MIAKTTCSIPFKYFVGVSNASYMNLMLNDSSNCKKKKRYLSTHFHTDEGKDRNIHSTYIHTSPPARTVRSPIRNDEMASKK